MGTTKSTDDKYPFWSDIFLNEFTPTQ